MKASNLLSIEDQLKFRNYRLDQALLQFYATQNGANENRHAGDEIETLLNLPLAKKEQIYFDELERRSDEWRCNELRNSLLKNRQLIRAGFVRFSELPSELRLKIWAHSMEDHLVGRIHIITKKRGRFRSNQPITPLLSTCTESRTAYLETGAGYAYGTYINFDADIIYIRPFSNTMGFGPLYIDDKHQLSRCFQTLEESTEPNLSAFGLTRNEHGQIVARLDLLEPESDEIQIEANIRLSMFHRAAAIETFRSFLNHLATSRIKSLAATADFWCAIPGEDGPWQTHYQMRQKMPVWEQTLLVFNDSVDQDVAWKSTRTTFREKIAGDRIQSNLKLKTIRRLLRNMEALEEPGFKTEAMRWRFVCVQEREVGETPHGQVALTVEADVDALINELKMASMQVRTK